MHTVSALEPLWSAVRRAVGARIITPARLLPEPSRTWRNAPSSAQTTSNKLSYDVSFYFTVHTFPRCLTDVSLNINLKEPRSTSVNEMLCFYFAQHFFLSLQRKMRCAVWCVTALEMCWTSCSAVRVASITTGCVWTSQWRRSRGQAGSAPNVKSVSRASEYPARPVINYPSVLIQWMCPGGFGTSVIQQNFLRIEWHFQNPKV